MLPQIEASRVYRTPDSAFENLPDFSYAPSYANYGSLRYAFIDVTSDEVLDLRTGSTLSAQEASALSKDEVGIRTVLCLHGEPAWSFLYRKMIPGFLKPSIRLSDAELKEARTRYLRTRVLVPDLLGFGRSDKPIDDQFYTYEMHRQFLIHFITTQILEDARAIQGDRVTLVVQDWGGILGLTLPLAFPILFTHLIVMNTDLPLGQSPSEGWSKFRDFIKRSPDLDVGSLFKRGTPLNDDEVRAYNAPFVGGQTSKAGVRRFPEILPAHPSMQGVAESQAALAYFNSLPAQRFTDNSLTAVTHNAGVSKVPINVFVAVGASDPVLGTPVMRDLCQKAFRSTGYVYHEISAAGHFVQEWGARIPALADAAWERISGPTPVEKGATWDEAGLGSVTWTAPIKSAEPKKGEKRTLTFVTGNANKLREVKQILASTPDFPYELTNTALDLPEIQGTTQEVARATCSAAAAALGGPCITEDTALCFTALKGLPGPYVKDFMKSVGHDGLNAMLDGFEDRSATALCTFAYSAGPGQEVILFEGKTEGSIVKARGPTFFGWDPVFQVQGTELTYAEMEPAQKNAISHRYRALSALQAFLCNPSGNPQANM